MSEKVSELIEELSQDPVNILRIKILCRDNPGLIASAGLRSKVWTLLLLGSAPGSGKAYEGLVSKDITNLPDRPCEEQHVLEADVHRTRADVEEFRSTAVRNALKLTLQKFCLSHSVQYKQGMNEVLAPFLYVLPPPKGSLLPYLLFEAFLVRYLQRFMCQDDSSYLFKAFRLFHILLLYFDPQLGGHLHEQDFIPELYTPQWFLTLYSRSLPLQHVVRLWDMMIAVDDPSFTFFIGLCLLRKKRTELLTASAENIPEIMTTIQFRGEEEIDAVVTEARELYRIAPRCFLRNLRLCCVSNTELMPQPTGSKASESFAATAAATSAVSSTSSSTMGRNSNNSSAGSVASAADSFTLNVNEYEQVLAVQATRCCLMLSARELVDAVAPILPCPTAATTASTTSTSATAAAAEGSVDSLRSPQQQYVIIDVRSYQETLVSGGGSLPRAIQLEPEFLNRPEALSIWMQHFDGTRGCNICIVDVPPAKYSMNGFALWRRLLWGEGDGNSSSSERMFATEELDDADDLLADGFSATRITNNSNSNSGDGSSNIRQQQLRSQQKQSRLAAAVSEADSHRPAVQLAIALQQHSFPNVSVLDGGFPALVEQLMSTRNSVEPVIINHDKERWIQFLRSTGRDARPLENHYARNVVRRRNKINNSAAEGNGVGNALNGNSSSGNSNSNSISNRSNEPRSIRDLSQQQIYESALRSAERLGHCNTAQILRFKLNIPQPPEAIATDADREVLDGKESATADAVSSTVSMMS